MHRLKIRKIMYLLLIFSIIITAGCTGSCPEDCDDNNVCTTDSCSEATNFKCVYLQIDDCCNADSDCESKESVCEKHKCTISDEILEKEAQKVAQGLSIAWQREDYGKAYEYFHPNLKELKTKDEFVAFVKYTQDQTKFNLIYDKVVPQERNLAYAYYTYSSDSIFQPKTPALEMNYINGEWKINAFVGYFSKNIEEEKYKDFVMGYIEKIKEELSYLDDFPKDFECKETFEIDISGADSVIYTTSVIDTTKAPTTMKDAKNDLLEIQNLLGVIRVNCVIIGLQIDIMYHTGESSQTTKDNVEGFVEDIIVIKQKLEILGKKISV